MIQDCQQPVLAVSCEIDLDLSRIDDGVLDEVFDDAAYRGAVSWHGPAIDVPELDGLSATRLLREFEAAEGLARTPVIMLTANAMDEHIRAGREAGADQHLSKPIRAQALIETIVHAILAAEQAQGDREVA